MTPAVIFLGVKSVVAFNKCKPSSDQPPVHITHTQTLHKDAVVLG